MKEEAPQYLSLNTRLSSFKGISTIVIKTETVYRHIKNDDDVSQECFLLALPHATIANIRKDSIIFVIEKQTDSFTVILDEPQS